MLFEVLKRTIPFLLAMALGILAAFPFMAASSGNSGSEVNELRKENARLKRENCRLKNKMGKSHGFRHSGMRLHVPAPPAPPEPPLAPAPPAAPDAR